MMRLARPPVPVRASAAAQHNVLVVIQPLVRRVSRRCAIAAACVATGTAAPLPLVAAEPRDAVGAKPGMLNAVPLVAPAEETLVSALKRAARLTATAGLPPEASEAAKSRRRAAQQLDGLTKALTAPLAAYCSGFPSPARLHPFERALLDLTVGTREYERTLARIDLLRKGTLEVGKGHAGCAAAASGVLQRCPRGSRARTRASSFANRSTSVQEAEARRTAGFKGARARAAPSHAPR
jgi:nucleolar GTP-binding protein